MPNSVAQDTSDGTHTVEEPLLSTVEEPLNINLPDYMIDLVACNTEVKPLPTKLFTKTEAEMVAWMSGKNITPRKADEVAAYILGNWPGPRKTWKAVAAVFRSLVVKEWNNKQPTGTGTRRSRPDSLPNTEDLKTGWG
ncbi:MAG: hypothetical protein V3S68_03625 [Dehalococcoidia bacterium]